ncbi:unnamed protein product, partial [Vitis vinifera]|uniref:Aminotransferase class I/classII large domain-containing protein n=1 Tax=Vitis vinifera TaxID=29760 RepID=D7U9L2_VITVI
MSLQFSFAFIFVNHGLHLGRTVEKLPGNKTLNLYLCCFSFQVVESIINCLNISSDPATFIQGAFPEILEKTKEDFFSNTIIILRECADIIHERIKDIPCITYPQKPEGSMFVMLNLSLLEDIDDDDVEFYMKLSKEESVIVLTGVAVGMKNWPRVTFAIDPPSLEDGLGRIKAFYQRHMLRRNKDFISDQFNAC